MQTVHLFRHIQSDFNTRQDDYVGGRSNESPPSALGLRQGVILGHWIARQGIIPDVVYASPAVRARETARISLAAAGIDMPVIIDDRLQELSQGSSEGMLRSEVYTPEVLARIKAELMDFRLPGGQSMNDAADSMMDWLGDARKAQPQGDIFAFSHGFAIRCLVGRLNNWGHADIRSHELDNATVTRLRFDDQGNFVGMDFGINTQV